MSLTAPRSPLRRVRRRRPTGSEENVATANDIRRRRRRRINGNSNLGCGSCGKKGNR